MCTTIRDFTLIVNEPFAFVNGEINLTVFEVIYYYDSIKSTYIFFFNKDRTIYEDLYH